MGATGAPGRPEGGTGKAGRRDGRAASHVEEHVVEQLLGGEYPPGSDLPPERELAAALGVARPTVREALQRLARDGWVTLRRSRPARANDFWLQGNVGVLAALLRRSDTTDPRLVRWLLELREALAPAFARRAVELAPARVVGGLARAPELPDEADAFASFDWELQRLLASLCDNPLYLLLLNGCAALYRRAALEYFASSRRRDASRRFYRELLAAAMATDAGRAAEVVRHAMRESTDLWRETAEGGHP